MRSGVGRPREPLGWFSLARLARPVGLRSAWRARMTTPPPEWLEHALASTYAGCARLGLRREALELLGAGTKRERTR